MASKFESTIEPRPVYGILLRLLAIFFLGSMFMIVKVAGDMGVHVLESLFYRFFFGFLLMFLWLINGPGLSVIKTKRLRLHGFRTLIGAIAMGLSFWAALLLQLPELAMISFSSPFIVTIMSIVLLGEIVGRRRWTALIIGFIGVLIVVQPGGSGLPMKGSLVAMSGVVLTAYTFILIKYLSTTESSTAIVFWYTLLAIPVLGVVMIFVAQPHPPMVWLLLVSIALLGALGQVALSESIKYAPMSLIAPMDYSNLLWSTLYGFLIWGFIPGPSLWIGAPIIIGAGLYIAFRQDTLKKQNMAAENV
ncbi:MAG: DMT family transporter [Litorimonas sp.]